MVDVHFHPKTFRKSLGIAQDDGPLIFNGLSLSIPSGSSCALVGRTGCGKSSFLSALVRLYPLCGGKLYLHGILTQLPSGND